MREHKIVKGAFYCSATCMEVDEVSLRAEVNFAVKGVWNPTRPPQGAQRKNHPGRTVSSCVVLLSDQEGTLS